MRSTPCMGFAHFLYTHRQNHHNRPGIHSSDVIHIPRSACLARSAFTRLNSFLSLSLHHYPSASPLASLSHVSLILFFNNSLYHRLMRFNSCFTPLFCWLTLFFPLFLYSSFPLDFEGLQTVSIFLKHKHCCLMFSPWCSSTPVSAINSLKFFMMSLLLFSNLDLPLCLKDYLICCLSCFFSLVCPEALYITF